MLRRLQDEGRTGVLILADGILEYRNYDQNWGSDFDYDHVAASLHHFTPFGEYSSLGVRLEGEAVTGDVPFFGYQQAGEIENIELDSI